MVAKIGIPNLLTLTRLFLCPLFLLLYFQAEALGISPTTLPFVLLAVLILLELSDAFDGFLARKFGQVTEFGKLFDPMADSIARITVFLTLTAPPVSLPVVFVFVFIYRDSVISTLRSICALRGVALAARPAGKIKAILQAIAAFACVLAMIPHAFSWISTDTLKTIASYFVGVAAFYSIYSGILYLYESRKVLSSAMKTPSAKK